MTSAAHTRNDGWTLKNSFPVWENHQLAHRWDTVPVLTSTLIALELLLSEPVIDLSRTADVILTDLGATLHTLRAAGIDETARVADCLAGIELSSWLEQLATHAVAHGSCCNHITAHWRHAAEIARHARWIAETTRSALPDTAYLAGLLDELHLVPHLLGWTTLEASTEIDDPLPAAFLRFLQTAPLRQTVEAARQLTNAAPVPGALIHSSSQHHQASTR